MHRAQCSLFLMRNVGMENQNNKSKTKKIIDIVVNVVLWLFVIFSIFVTVVAVSVDKDGENVPIVGGKCYLTVLSSSMEGKKPDGIAADKPSGFNKGDLIVAKYIGKDLDAKTKLGIGDVISFRFDVNNDGKIDKGELNTHRIVDLVKDGEGNVTGYITKGDNNLTNDANPVYFGDIVAVYSGRRLAGIGNVLTFLSSKLGFALCIILPLFLFFAYELFVFIKTLLTVKNEGKKVITAEDEELIKQRAIEEYLRRQQESASAVQGNVQGGVQESVRDNDAENADN